MLVLITYDVNTETSAGKKRLRKVAKHCVNYGQRVQHSVFECVLDPAQCREVQHKLEKTIDKEKDSLRFYYLGNNYKSKVEHIGAKQSFESLPSRGAWIEMKRLKELRKECGVAPFAGSVD